MRVERMALAVMAGALTLLVPGLAAAAPKPKLTISSVSQAEGNSGTTAFTFTVTLSATSANTVTVNYSTSNGTATAPSDYTAASGQLSFAPGVTIQPITILVDGDVLAEGNETFTVSLRQAKFATIAGGGRGTGTITNDDAPPTIAITDVSLNEGNAGSVNAVFTVSLSAASGQTITMNYATANGTASAGADYVNTTGALTFPVGSTTQTITVPVFADVLDEVDETFFVNLSNVVNADAGGASDLQGLGTILDDDVAPTLSINDVVTVEGNAGNTNAVFTVSLSAPSGQTVTVNYDTADDTAQVGDNDFVAQSGTLTFNAGTTTQTVTVPVVGDTTVEPNETYFVDLSSPGNASILDGQGVGTIVDDDGTPAYSIDDVRMAEGTGGTTTFTFTVTLAPAAGSTVTVDYATADDTASSTSDFTAQNGTLTFNPGDPIPPGCLTPCQTISIDVAADALNEAEEGFFVNLSNATGGANLGRVQGVGTIQNDDALPTVSVDSVNLTENDTGSADLVFTVSLSAASGQTVTLNHATADGTASELTDYTLTAGTLSFPPGIPSLTVAVPILGDTLSEANETFFLNLSNLQNADPTGSTLQGQGTILDDDPLPSLSIDNVEVGESDGVPGPDLIFTVTLSPASGQTVTVNFATADGAVDPATGGTDYTPVNGTLTFAAGETTQTVTVPVLGDTTEEQNETMEVDLTGPAGATVAGGVGVGTILNDDGLTFSVDDVVVTEGDGGSTNATFTIALSETSLSDVSVDFATADGTAVDGSDYLGGSGTVTVTASNLTNTFTVQITGDTLPEADETFFVNLSNATAGTIFDGQGQGTVTNDDPLAGLSIDDVSVTEGDAGLTAATFTVSLPPTGQPVSVHYDTADGSATAGVDYQAASGDLNFPASNTPQSQTVTVQVAGDTTGEGSETFFVNLSAEVNAAIADGSGRGTILDDDVAPKLSIDDVTVVEGNSGTVDAVFTVSLLSASGLAVSVGYAAGEGTATGGTDYTATSGTLTFNPGDLTKTVTVPVIGDAIGEADETFLLELSNAVNASLADAHGLGTITNDDAATVLSLTIDDVTVAEPRQPGVVAAVFSVRLSSPVATDVYVGYQTSNGNAQAGLDYTAAAGTLTFAPGTTVQTISVPVLGDHEDEGNEAFLVRLVRNRGIALAKGTAQGTIIQPFSRRSRCRPIAYAPFTIDGSGNYCLIRDLVTSISQGAAVTIDADSVTLDLNGFMLRGAAAGPATQASGVLARDRNDVVVRNGAVSGFLRGVFLDDSTNAFTGSRVENVRVDASTLAGIWVEGRGNLVRGNHVASTGGSTLFGTDTEAYGIVSRGPGGRLVDNDVIETAGAGTGEALGLLLISADGSVVEHNRVSNPALSASPSVGISVSSGAEVLVSNNRISKTDAGVAYRSGTGKYRDNITSGVVTPFTGGVDGGNNN